MADEGYRVLVVEDDRDFAGTLDLALKTRNCRVAIARSGEEAIRMFREQTFDIAFMDIRLPGMDGLQSLAEIIGVVPQARIVMMTGFSDPHLFEQARRAGAMDVLRKPFRIKAFLAYLDRLDTGPPLSPGSGP